MIVTGKQLESGFVCPECGGKTFLITSLEMVDQTIDESEWQGDEDFLDEWWTLRVECSDCDYVLMDRVDEARKLLAAHLPDVWEGYCGYNDAGRIN